jgi:hypothetical protein
MSYGLWVGALPLLIEWAAKVVEAVKFCRLRDKLCPIASGKYRIHFSYERAGLDRELHATA